MAPRPFDLDRFRQAQRGTPSLARALSELTAGAKVSHWIWYVFPQLRGLGSSPLAVRYGLDGVEEAEAYLRENDLGEGLARAVALVNDQLDRGMPLETLMGSAIDVLKLVSSMTLFAAVARERELGAGAARILARAAASGHPPCAFTQACLRAGHLPEAAS